MTETTPVNESSTEHTENDILEKYGDADPSLIPLFEQPAEWFQEPVSCYETAFGPFGDIVNLTPEAVTFRAAVYDEVDKYRQSLLDKWHQSEIIDGRVSVLGKDTATNQNEPVVWLKEFGRHVEIFERVPFDSRVTTPDDLKHVIDPLIDGEPQWDEMFDAARDVVVEMGLSDSVDTLTDDQLHTTLQLLEVGRDDVDQLTDDQKTLLNEAHCIVQEMQELMKER